MSSKVDALEHVRDARSEWDAGNFDEALQHMKAAKDVLVEFGYSPENMPRVFSLIDNLTDAILRERVGA